MYLSTHRAPRIYKPQLPARNDLVVFLDIAVVVQISREGCGVDLIERHCVVVEWLPLGWARCVDDCFAGLVVAG